MLPGLLGRIILGGSWVDISRVISRRTIVITHIRGLITPLITTHEPPSTVYDNMPQSPILMVEGALLVKV